MRAWRWLFTKSWSVFGHYPPLVYTYLVCALLWPLYRLVPLLGFGALVALPWVPLPDFRWTLLDTFDSLTPSYQSTHETYEVFNWFRKAQFAEIEPTDWGSTAFRGVKCYAGQSQPNVPPVTSA